MDRLFKQACSVYLNGATMGSGLTCKRGFHLGCDGNGDCHGTAKPHRTAASVSSQERWRYITSVPEAITQGDTIEEAMAMASEALELALTFYMDKWADLPVPGSLKRGMRVVRVPALREAKFRLYSALRAARVSKIDLTRRLKCSPSQVDRLLDI